MKEKILPQIRLKYFVSPSNDAIDDNPGFECFICKKNKTKTGGGLDAHTDNPKVICEDCAIDRYMNDFGFSTREAAVARRRRIFDVGYLFQEIIFDEYLNRYHKTYKDLSEDEFNKIFKFGLELYSIRFTKKQKIKLEEIIRQEVIEEKLNLAAHDALKFILF